jgi:hypothetical protein
MSTGTYKPSPIGESLHAWITKPDTKYNSEGVFKTGLLLEGEAAETFKADIKAKSDEAFERLIAEKIENKQLKPADAKKWSVYYPFEEETDDENGNPTGRVLFNFKQNAKIRLRDGETKAVVIGIRDSKDKPVKKNVAIFDGSKLRVMYKPRDIVMTGVKQIGVRLDFSMVQIIELAKSGAGGGGFGSFGGEGGFVADEAGEGTGTNDKGSEDAEY